MTAPERPQVITDTTVIMGSGDTDVKDSCPGCGGKVFEAEKWTGKFGIYHKKCFKCFKGLFINIYIRFHVITILSKKKRRRTKFEFILPFYKSHSTPSILHPSVTANVLDVYVW